MLLSQCTSAGCAAKMSSAQLDRVIGQVFNTTNKNKEDGFVGKFPQNMEIIQTLDVIAPIVDNPYMFGQIAVVHSLSDVYAMGGIPLYATNICCFPENENDECLKHILLGAKEKLLEENVTLAGGHTITNSDIKYGLSVTGYIESNTATLNSNLQEDDLLILTKPIGTGILSSWLKLEPDANIEKLLTQICIQSNKIGYDIVKKFQVKCMTDVTGFGLGGHLIEIAKSSNKTIEITYNNIPILDEAIFFLENYQLISKRQKENIQAYSHDVKITNNIDSKMYKSILFDPQTSGGLIIASNRNSVDNICRYLSEQGYHNNIIGKVTSYTEKYLTINL